MSLFVLACAWALPCRAKVPGFDVPMEELAELAALYRVASGRILTLLAIVLLL